MKSITFSSSKKYTNVTKHEVLYLDIVGADQFSLLHYFFLESSNFEKHKSIIINGL